MGEVKLTRWQRTALSSLDGLHEKFPHNSYGFNPPTPRLAAVWRRMEPMGLVAISRLSSWHFRYSITDAGRAAYRGESSHGA